MTPTRIDLPHYITKSFWTMGKRLDYCLGCKYCRELDGETNGFNIDTCPTEICSMFDKLPVAVNLFHGDPIVQVDHTIMLLQKLQEAHHRGPVVVVTKGDFSLFPKHMDFDLDLHFAFSTFGVDSPLDGGSMYQFESNLQAAAAMDKHRYSVEFRPIIHGINDGILTIDRVMMLAMKYKMAVGYSGLQGKPGVVSKWDAEIRDLLQPYPGTNLGYKKYVSPEVDAYIRSFGWLTFRKTSCLISYVHRMNRDYNAHYYRPNEMGCIGCPMFSKCFGWKRDMDAFLSSNRDTRFELPFGHIVTKSEGHQCPWLHKGCSFPSADCSNLSGWFIDVGRKVTTADVRVIKWLTGLTVCSDFEESQYLSEIWS